MTKIKYCSTSGAKAEKLLAQRGPDEASERPIRAGDIAKGGAGGGPPGAARPLALYYLLQTSKRSEKEVNLEVLPV